MTLWKITPVADPEDARWLDYPIWQEIIVRAPTSAQARLTASDVLEAAPEAVGNESRGGGSAGLDDEKLYQITRLDPAEAGLEKDEEGAPAVLRADGPRENDAPS